VDAGPVTLMGAPGRIVLGCHRAARRVTGSKQVPGVSPVWMSMRSQWNVPSVPWFPHDRLWPALAYVGRNPVRADIVQSPAGYRWSSAAAHVSGIDTSGLLDMAWWRREAQGIDWAVALSDEAPETAASLRRCRYAGRPFGPFRNRVSRWNGTRPLPHPAGNQNESRS
jgi:hypothetical protein